MKTIQKIVLVAVVLIVTGMYSIHVGVFGGKKSKEHKHHKRSVKIWKGSRFNLQLGDEQVALLDGENDKNEYTEYRDTNRLDRPHVNDGNDKDNTQTNNNLDDRELKVYNTSGIAPFKHYGLMAKNGRCYLDKQMSCEAVYSRIYECLAGKAFGREPLPNFYLQESIDFSLYRQASIGFVHLPKAGGTSVEDILSEFKRREWPSVHVLHCTHFFRAATTHFNSTGNVLLTSKRTFGLHNYMNPNIPFLYMTWFRHPITRLVSAYHYIKKMEPKIHKLYVRYVLKTDNMTQFLQTMKQSDALTEFDNFAVRLLQFGDYPIIDTTFEDCCGAYVPGVTNVPKVTREHYLIARRNLETKIGFIGILEDFKTSQDMLCYMLNIPCPKEEIHVNANKHEHDLSDFEMQELMNRNYWDLKLYKDAKRIYMQQKQKYLNLTKGRT